MTDDLDHPVDQLAHDPAVAARGVTIFEVAHDDRGGIRVGVASREPADVLAAFLSERAGRPLEVTVQAPSSYVTRDVAWTGWTLSADERQLEVWHVDEDDDGAELEAVLQEHDARVVITVRGPRWQGARRSIGRSWRKQVRLAAPLGHREVLDGADMCRRPRRKPT